MDLFAGSGSLGIESISRGADCVIFVDKSIKSVKLISENINNIKCFYGNYKIIRKDVNIFLKTLENPVFDIVFIDPPYKIDFKVMKDLFALLRESPAINKESVLVYEYFSKRCIENEIEGFKVIKNSNFKDKIVTYLGI